MGNLHWFIARHYLGAGRSRGLLSLITWIALGGVTVGVTALVVVIAVMTGMQEDLQGKILESTPHVLVLEQGSSLRMNDWQAVVDTAMGVDGVVGAAPFVLTSISLTRGLGNVAYNQPATLYGVRVDTAQAAVATDMERNILQGVLDLEPPASGLSPILVGIGLADRMQLFPGDTLIVISFENLKQGLLGLSPTMRNFEVTGTFATGMWDYDNENVYTTLEAAQELLSIRDERVVSGVGVRTVDPERATEISDELQRRLGYPYVVQSWKITNQALFSALKLEKIAMFVILSLIVIVAAFNIVSTLVMVVADRTREIGILKAMGMTRGGILRVFVLQGAWIGVVGTVVGTGLGVVLCWLLDRYEIIKIPPDVYFVDHLPVSLRVSDVLAIVVGSIVVAFAATVYPAVQASRLEPVDAIRHE